MIHLAAMFKDVPMTSDELGFVLDKILRLLNDVDMQELPPLVYQLLLLAAKVNPFTPLLYKFSVARMGLYILTNHLHSVLYC